MHACIVYYIIYFTYCITEKPFLGSDIYQLKFIKLRHLIFKHSIVMTSHYMWHSDPKFKTRN